MILLIVLLHSIPVFLIGAIWLGSKVATVIAAIISGFIAASTGNPAFTVADLLGIFTAAWLSFAVISSPNENVKTRRSQKIAQKKMELWAKEKIILRKLHEEFYSDNALRRKRSKRRISAVSLCFVLLIAFLFLLMNEKVHGFVETAVALAVVAFVLSILWGLLNAEWGKPELELRIRKIRREIEKLDR